MSFFVEPKIKRIARHLQANFAAYHQDKWAHLLVVAENTGIRYDALNIPLETSSWFRAKEDFSWQASDLDIDSIPQYKFDNASKQEIHYRGLLERANAIVDEINKPQPDYARVVELVGEIKIQSVRVPSVLSGEPIDIKIGKFSGGNLLADFCIGIIGLIYAPIMGLASVLVSPFYYAEESKYCGGPDFFLDTAKYFCDSLCKVISSVVFPLAMLRSKYETDSYNPLKGELMRSLDSIVALAQKEDEALVRSSIDIGMLTS